MAADSALPAVGPAGASRPRDDLLLAPLAAAACVVVSVMLAAGHIAGAGVSALAAAVFGVVTVWCLTEPRAGRSLVVFGLYIGMLDGYLKLRTGSRDLTIARDVLLWAIAAGALLRAVHRGDDIRLPPLGVIVVAFALVVVAQIANPSAPGLTQSLAGVRQHLEFVPLFFLGYAFVRTAEDVKVLLLVLVAAAAANGIVGYVQSTLTPEQLAGWGSGYRERILGTGIFTGQSKVGYDIVDGVVVGTHVRPFGLGSELGSGAVVAALAIPGLIALLFSQHGWLRVVLLVVGVPAIVLGVATSGSRASLLACGVSVLGFAVLAMASRNAMRVFLGVLVGAVLVAGMFAVLGADNDAVRRARTVAQENSITTFLDERSDSVGKLDEYIARYPLGAGVGTVGPAAQYVTGAPSALDSETQWNLSVVETGVPGLLLLLGLGASVVVLTLTRVRHFPDADLRIQLAALAAPLVAMFALSFAGPTTVSAPSSPYMWLASGVLAYWLLGPGRPAASVES